MPQIYPICRSITGHGVREMLRTMGAHIKLEMHELPIQVDDSANRVDI